MRVVVGRVGRPQGVRGEVTVEVRTDEPELRFAPDAELFPVWPSQSGGGPSLLRCAGHRFQSGRLILTVVGVGDREAAEALRGVVLESEVDVLAQTEPDEFHDQALLGLAVLTRSGTKLGTVGETVHLPGQDLLAMVPEDGSDPVLIPFVAAIVPVVDLARGVLVVELPDGLLPGSGAEQNPDD